jgi:hypothetical protein
MRYILAGLGVAIAVTGQALGQAAPMFEPETRASISTQIPMPEISSAISSFVSDGTGGETLLTVARAGHRDAARVLARECLRGRTCVTTRGESHELLIAAAQTDYASAQTLAGLYRDGEWGGQAYPVQAAKWIMHADKLGSTSARYMLDSLPIEAVREAGAVHLLPPPLEPVETVQSPPQAEEKDAGLYSIDDAEIEALTDLLFGTGSIGGGDVEPPHLEWPGQAEGFPIFVDTGLSDVGDAAASCTVAAQPVLENLLARTKADKSDLGAYAQLQIEAPLMESYFSALNNPDLNGGFEGAAVNAALEQHTMFRDTGSQYGPEPKYCEANFTQFMVDKAIAKARAID